MAAIGEKCPCLPPLDNAETSQFVVLLRGNPVSIAPVLSSRFIQPQKQARVRMSFSRAHQERGPPSLLS
jgi:hypothetical protein